MRLYAVTMMKDEEDVADRVLYHLVQQGVDGIIVADNLSTDATPARLREAKRRVAADPRYADVDIVVRLDHEVAYRQSQKMTQLGHDAAARGATWILPFDADELWFGVGGTLKDVLSRAEVDGRVSASAEYWNHRITTLDEPGDPFAGMRHREKDPTGFHKTAYRHNPRAVISNGNHFVTYASSFVEDPDPLLGGLVMRHFPFRSEDQFVKKIANGHQACRALPPTADLYNGAGWNPYFPAYEADGVEGLRQLYRSGCFDPDGFVFDPAPYAPFG